MIEGDQDQNRDLKGSKLTKQCSDTMQKARHRYVAPIFRYLGLCVARALYRCN